MTAKVVVVGWDSADRAVYTDWMNRGELPNLQRLRGRGAYAPLESLGFSQAEASWTAVISGTSPFQNGFWSQLKFFPENYKSRNMKTYTYEECPPFYALGDDYKVAAFDIPQTRLSDNVNGIQVLAYGAHSPQTPRVSKPDHILKDVITKYGDHPTINNDFARLWWKPSMQRLQKGLIAGAEKRGRICRDLIAEQDWDLLFTVFGETHSGGHYFWHLSQDDHPLHDPMKGQLGDGDPMLEVAQAVDKSLGEMMDAADDDTYFVVFSQEGMDPNNLDVPSMVFLPELLFRLSFPGEQGFEGSGPAGSNQPPKDMITFPLWLGWTRGMWGMKNDPNFLRRWARRLLPLEAGRQVEKVFGGEGNIKYPGDVALNMQLPLWYEDHWSKMKAFALPSFSDGYIRLNVEGREAQGIIPRAEYDQACDEISAEVMALKNSRTGKPLAKRIIRTRKSIDEDDSRLNDADLVVIWDTDPADVVDSPSIGRIGPIPHKRTGGHNSHCFAVIAGPGIEPGSTLPEGSALDISATVRTFLGADVPARYSGKPLFDISKAA